MNAVLGLDTSTVVAAGLAVTGREPTHVAVDDTSRLAYVEVLDDETAATTVGFLARAVTWFADRGITVERVMTDNGPPYRSTAWSQWCATAGIRRSDEIILPSIA